MNEAKTTKPHPELLAMLGTARLLEQNMLRAYARVGVLVSDLAAALAIPDEAARANKVAPIIDELEGLARKAGEIGGVQ